MTYFTNCTTQEELKKEYRRLCKELHPDNGGDAREFVEMRRQFEEIGKTETWRTFRNREGQTYTKDVHESPAEFMKTIEELLKLDGVIVEVCGSWLWITGETKQHKDAIKALGGRWSRNKAAWYIHREPYKKRSKKVYSLDEIRAYYGSETYTKKEEREALKESA